MRLFSVFCVLCVFARSLHLCRLFYYSSHSEVYSLMSEIVQRRAVFLRYSGCVLRFYGILHLLSGSLKVVSIVLITFAGMKRLLHIFPALVLSLLIVVMSAGLSVVVCMHSGHAEVAQVAEAQGNHSCHGMKGCMVVKTIKLAPSMLAQSHLFDFAQNWVAAAPSLPLLSLAHSFIPVHAPTARVAVWYAPPRAYLHQIRVLRL